MSSTWMCENCGGQVAVGTRVCTQCGHTMRGLGPESGPEARGSAAATPPTPPDGDVLGGEWDPKPRPPAGPPQREPPRAPRQAARPNAPGPVPAMGHGQAVEGMVRGVQMRIEQRNEMAPSVWTFRLERYDDSGKRVMLVPVEMRGIGFEGSIHDGDWVRVNGRMRAGTLHAKHLHNVTTGADVRVARTPKWLLVLVVAFICVVAAVVLMGWLGVFTSDPAGPPDDWPP